MSAQLPQLFEKSDAFLSSDIFPSGELSEGYISLCLYTPLT